MGAERWIVGQGPVGSFPTYTADDLGSWAECFRLLRALWITDLELAGILSYEESLNSLAFAQGYCEGQDFMWYSDLTKQNYFILCEETYANRIIRKRH